MKNEVYCLLLADSVDGVVDVINRYLYRLGYHLRIDSRSFYNTEDTSSSVVDDSHFGSKSELKNFINSFFGKSYRNIVFEIVSLTGNKCGYIYISPGQTRNYMVTIKIDQDSVFHSVKSSAGFKCSDNIILFSLSINNRTQTKGLFVENVESFLGVSLSEFVLGFDYSMKFIEYYQKSVLQWMGMTVDKSDKIDFSHYASSRLLCDTKGLCELVLSPMDRYTVNLETPIKVAPRQYPLLHTLMSNASS